MKKNILVSAVVAAITVGVLTVLPTIKSQISSKFNIESNSGKEYFLGEQTQKIDNKFNRGKVIKISQPAYSELEAKEAKELAVGLPDFSPLVAKVSQSVVSIEVTINGSSQVRKNLSIEDEDNENNDENERGNEKGNKGDSMDDLLKEFLEKNFGRRGPESGTLAPPVARPPKRASGAGFVFTEDGFIITNAHVVSGASTITVKTTNNKEYLAKVVGVDKKTDVAVIKINAKNLTPVRFGNINTVEVGQWVVAVGSPFGLENTVTAGIVSAKSRQLPDETYVPFLQTDVAINPGNSGGPLFNTRGEVIGVNSQIYSRTGGYMGLSFAIPVDVVVKISQSLMSTGKVTRGRIGVMVQTLNKELAYSFGLDEPKGALISGIEKGSPGEKAGLKEGDIVQYVDGFKIELSQDLPRIIGNILPGTNANLKIWRNKSEKNVKILLAEMKDAEIAKIILPIKDEPINKTDKLGLALHALTAEEQKKMGVEGGLIIDKSEGLAKAAGLRSGDLVLAVSGTSVKNQQEFNNAINNSGKNIALLVSRGGSKIFIPITITAEEKTTKQ